MFHRSSHPVLCFTTLAATRRCPHELEPVTLLFCLCGLFFGLLVFVFLCFCVLFVFGVLVLFRFVLW